MEYPTPSKKYKSTGHLVYSCQYHVIFCPKYRRKVLVPPIDQALKDLFLETAAQYDFSILDMEVMPDHVHLIVECNPRFGIMECVHKLKGFSSRRMRGEFPELKRRLPTLWTRSAFISSAGSVSLAVVQQYIENQKNK